MSLDGMEWQNSNHWGRKEQPNGECLMQTSALQVLRADEEIPSKQYIESLEKHKYTLDLSS